MDVMTCDFATLLALADQMPRERFEQIKTERPDFARWLDEGLLAIALDGPW